MLSYIVVATGRTVSIPMFTLN